MDTCDDDVVQVSFRFKSPETGRWVSMGLCATRPLAELTADGDQYDVMDFVCEVSQAAAKLAGADVIVSYGDFAFTSQKPEDITPYTER